MSRRSQSPCLGQIGGPRRVEISAAHIRQLCMQRSAAAEKLLCPKRCWAQSDPCLHDLSKRVRTLLGILSAFLQGALLGQHFGQLLVAHLQGSSSSNQKSKQHCSCGDLKIVFEPSSVCSEYEVRLNNYGVLKGRGSKR